MGGIDGFACCEEILRICKEGGYPRPTIVGMTATIYEGQDTKAAVAGMSSLLMKPLSADDFKPYLSPPSDIRSA
jgi:CheY-like chemotaxis protein